MEKFGIQDTDTKEQFITIDKMVISGSRYTTNIQKFSLKDLKWNEGKHLQ